MEIIEQDGKYRQAPIKLGNINDFEIDPYVLGLFK